MKRYATYALLILVAGFSPLSQNYASASDHLWSYDCKAYDSWFRVTPEESNFHTLYPGLYTGEHVVKEFRAKRPEFREGGLRFFVNRGRWLAECYLTGPSKTCIGELCVE